MYRLAPVRRHIREDIGDEGISDLDIRDLEDLEKTSYTPSHYISYGLFRQSQLQKRGRRSG